MKDTLVKRFVIGTFVSLYALVSVISTIHVIDFFELSNPYWLAVTLAIGFEVGAAASLASLVILKKMNKTIVWSLFITITLMQMQGNMFYAFINLEDFTSWSELFNLIEEDVLYQKRILAFVSGAILPLIALGFIKSLVDYIKPDDETEEQLTEGTLDDQLLHEDFETKPSKEYFEDIEEKVQQPTKEEREQILTKMMQDDQDLGLYEDFETTISDGLEPEEEWDEDHALDQVLNNILDDLENDNVDNLPKVEDIVPNTEIEEQPQVEIEQTSFNTVEKLPTPHLPENEPKVKSEDELWKEAMAKKAKEDMEAFIKDKNANK